MFPLDEFRDCLDRVVRIFKDRGIGFYLTGGAAFIAYGDPRTTQDIDVVIDAAPVCEHLTELIDAWRTDRFLLNDVTIREGLRTGRQFQLIDTVSTLKVDLYPHELIEGSFRRVREIEVLPGVKVPVASRPDLIAAKLVWISKGSHKSRRDVRQLLRSATEDEARIAREFAANLGLTALLDEVLAEPDEIDA